ncbi:hypothetical protein ERS070040_02545, partial [Streptococcus pneumoniae]
MPDIFSSHVECADIGFGSKAFSIRTSFNSFNPLIDTLNIFLISSLTNEITID